MITETHEKELTDTPCGWLKGCAGIANYANVSPRTAQNWLSNGLKARRLSARLVLVKPSDVDSFIERQSEDRASRRGVEARSPKKKSPAIGKGSSNKNHDRNISHAKHYTPIPRPAQPQIAIS